jgi:hypothetical protein
VTDGEEEVSRPPGYEEAVAAILKPTARITERQDRQGTVLSWVVLALVIAFIGLGLGGWALWRSNDDRIALHNYIQRQIAATALADYNNRVASCVTGNSFRIGDQELWAKVFTFPQAPNQTKAQQEIEAQNLASFKAFLKVHDALVDCSKIPLPVAALPALNLKKVPAGGVTVTTGTTIVTSGGNTVVLQGPPGPRGATGPQGLTGAAGASGASPFPIRFHFTFTVLGVGKHPIETETVNCDILNATTSFTCSSA